MFENIRLSFKGILSHKVRSLLTMLGIIIGIAAIIAIVSTIKGTNEQIKNNLIGAGNNTVTVALYQGDWEMDLQYESVPEGVPVITPDIQKQLEECDNIQSVSLYRQRNYMESIYYKNTSLSGGSVLGIDSSYFKTAGYRIKSGKGFGEKELSGTVKTAVIDTTAATGLFGGDDPVGKIIDINGEPFKIIGVAVQSSRFEPVINNYDDYQLYNQETSSGRIFIPINAWPVVFRYDEPQNCIVKAYDTDSMTKAGKEAADILNGMLTVSEDSGIKYKSEDQLERAKSLQKLSDSTNTLVICIAGISLLVGGIGVMNIMLVSVTERTREIGLKKALGARKKVILGQFLTEAAVLTSIGGLIGIAAGIILAQLISKFADVPVAISGISVAVSVIFSMAVGIIFGLIPSVKAANLNPIDALRYE